MVTNRSRWVGFGLLAAAATAWGTGGSARGANPVEVAPLPTTTVDPDRGHEAKSIILRNDVEPEAEGGAATETGNCSSIGAFVSQFSGPLRYRGDLIRITQSEVILNRIAMRLSFTGTADLYISLHHREADGTYLRVIPDLVILGAQGTGSARDYFTDQINGGAGIALEQGAEYAVAFAWGATTITFAHDGLTYPRAFGNGTVLGSLAFNLTNFDPPQPPVSDTLPALSVFTGGAYAMQLCFVPLPGACCSTGACTQKLESQCTAPGSFFHGQRTSCQDTLCGFGACCVDECGECRNNWTPEGCTAAGGIAHSPGQTCPDPSTGLCPKTTGACCLGSTCTPMCENECVSAGGAYRGDGTDCSPNTCIGACCNGATCSEVTSAQCATAGGTYKGNGSNCSPNVCVGACCRAGGCLNQTQNACAGAGGDFKGLGTTCATLPREQQCGGACCSGVVNPPDFCEVVTSRDLCFYTPDGFPVVAYRGDGTTCEGENPCALTGQYSACCLPDGACMNTTSAFCTAAWIQGVFIAGVRCESAPTTCPNLVNRCCLGDGSCQLLTGNACSARGGTPVPGQTTCSSTVCASSGGACCGSAAGDCTMTTRAQCETLGGLYQGDNSSCVSPAAACPGFGSCCRGSDGACFDDFSPAQCTSFTGSFQGSGETCAPDTCDEQGACCDGGSCSVATRLACENAGGAYQGDATLCGADSCRTGACCQANACTIQSDADCLAGAGVYFGHGSECLPNACTTGACCESNGGCTEGALAGACAGPGETFTAGAPCAQVTCVPSGACCVGVECLVTTEANCTSGGGTYRGDSVPCTAETCAASGACCVGAGCVFTTEASCGGQGGTYLGDNVACGTGTCAASGACCVGAGCLFTTEADCTQQGGNYLGDNIVCGAGTCTSSCSAILSTSPTNCAIDARQPNPPGNPGSPQGWDSITLNFDCGDTSALTAGDFSVSTTPSGTAPTVSTVTPAGSAITLNLSGPIPAGVWTCFTYVPTAAKACLAALPADVNSDRTSAPVDILDLIDHLNGARVPPLLIHQCDIDRSAICLPADILSEIDLLNGASGFLVWNTKNVPLCPSAP